MESFFKSACPPLPCKVWQAGEINAMKIYTKTGDQGETSMLGGKRVSKSCLEMEAIGEVDELNADLGLLISELEDGDVRKNLIKIQHKLFVIGSNLAGLQTNLDNLPKLESADIEYLENWIDEMNSDLPELTNFILPGGCKASALSYQARAVCRRAERKVIDLEKNNLSKKLSLYEGEPTRPARHCLQGMAGGSDGGGLVILLDVKQYLNRLSDLLFVLGRWLNKEEKTEEQVWKK